MRTPDVDVAPVERVLALRSFSAFEGLTPAELAVMAEHVRPRRFRKGALLSRRGVPVRALHFVLEGRVDVDDGSGRRRSMGAHDVVGGLGALIGDPLGQHAIARSDTVTLQLDREDMEEVFEDNFPIFRGVMRVLASMLVAAEKKLGHGLALRPRGTTQLDPAGELGLVERILLLRDSPSFAGAGVEALADLAEECEELELPAESCLWRAGEPAEHALLVVSGRVRAKAEDQDPFWFEPGAVVGGIESLADGPRWYSATADGKLRSLRIETQRLLDVIEDNMTVGMNLLRVIARGIRDVSVRVSDPGGAQPIA